jgi:hypothetical protein
MYASAHISALDGDEWQTSPIGRLNPQATGTR